MEIGPSINVVSPEVRQKWSAMDSAISSEPTVYVELTK
jgi:hypothetical protein